MKAAKQWGFEISSRLFEFGKAKITIIRELYIRRRRR